MKFIIETASIQSNIYNEMRKLGYHFLNRNDEELEMNFVRPLSSTGYPRFHIYLKINPARNASPSDAGGPKRKNIAFNLHLDQKRPIYKGTTAHSGEYEGELIEQEIARIKKSLNKDLKTL